MGTTNRRQEIAALLERGEREGLSYAELAHLGGIRPSTMATWAWRLRQEGRAMATKATSADPTPFVELVAATAPDDTRVEIELRSGRRIVVPLRIDGAQLSELVKVLER